MFRAAGEFAVVVVGPTKLAVPCGLSWEFSLTNFFMSANSALSAGNTVADRAIATAAMVLPTGVSSLVPADLSRDPLGPVQGVRRSRAPLHPEAVHGEERPRILRLEDMPPIQIDHCRIIGKSRRVAA